MNSCARSSLLVGLLLVIAVPSWAQDAPSATDQAKKIEALVTDAATLADKSGNAALTEFRKATPH